MAKATIVRFSDLQGRWDPEFYLALDPLKARVAELRATMEPEEARCFLETFTLAELKPLVVLSRGPYGVWNSDIKERVVKEYPHLSRAMMEGELSNVVAKVTELAQREIDRLDALRALQVEIQAPRQSPAKGVAAPAESPRFEAGMMYPLLDAERYDDDHGEGYRFAAIAPDASPGKCHTHDAWIVNEKGEVHPGYNANPIPVQIWDLDMAKGVPNPKDPPEPKSIFDSPWVR